MLLKSRMELRIPYCFRILLPFPSDKFGKDPRISLKICQLSILSGGLPENSRLYLRNRNSGKFLTGQVRLVFAGLAAPDLDNLSEKRFASSQEGTTDSYFQRAAESKTRRLSC